MNVELSKKIRDVVDFPRPGIVFKDITTLLKDPAAFRFAIDGMCEHYKNASIDVVVGVESRGFIVGSVLAYLLGTGFVPVRKVGKLPAETIQAEYNLEYGTAAVEMHKDAVSRGQRALVVDDLLATGGTAAATLKLVEQLGGTVVGIAFLVELTFLNGREPLRGHEVFSLIQY